MPAAPAAIDRRGERRRRWITRQIPLSLAAILVLRITLDAVIPIGDYEPVALIAAQRATETEALRLVGLAFFAAP